MANTTQKPKQPQKSFILDLVLLSWNICGASTNRTELQNLISVHKPSIICLQETHFYSDYTPHFKNYQIFRKDRVKGKKGGVAILCHDTINASNIILPSTTSLETVAINININNSIISICCFYDAKAAAPIQDYNITKTALNNTFLLAGDTNSHHPMFGDTTPDKKGMALVKWCTDNQDIVCFNTGVPTRIGYGTQKDTSIDVIFGSVNLYEIAVFDTLESIGSDHLPLHLKFFQNYSIRTNTHPSYHYNKADWSLFYKILSDIVIPNFSNNNNINVLNLFFSENVIKAANSSIPHSLPKPSFSTQV